MSFQLDPEYHAQADPEELQQVQWAVPELAEKAFQGTLTARLTKFVKLYAAYATGLVIVLCALWLVWRLVRRCRAPKPKPTPAPAKEKPRSARDTRPKDKVVSWTAPESPKARYNNLSGHESSGSGSESESGSGSESEHEPEKEEKEGGISQFLSRSRFFSRSKTD